MKFEKIKSHAKVNLSLNVLGKRKSKLHDLETLVAFVDLHDQIFIKRTNNKNHIVKFSGDFSNKMPKINTVSNYVMKYKSLIFQDFDEYYNKSTKNQLYLYLNGNDIIS